MESNKYANYTLEEKVRAVVELMMDHIDMQHDRKTDWDDRIKTELTALYESL